MTGQKKLYIKGKSGDIDPDFVVGVGEELFKLRQQIDASRGQNTRGRLLECLKALRRNFMAAVYSKG